MKENPDNNYICDRYYYTSLADSLAYKKISSSEVDFFKKFLEKNTVTPDFVFFCTCNRVARVERITSRNADSVADDTSVEFQNNMEKSFHIVLPPTTIIIDSTNCNVQELTQKVIRHMNLKSR
jgi:thymidylate kinase